MSIIDDLLIQVDDAKETDANNLLALNSKFSKQVILSTLGRLISKGFISKKEVNNNLFFSITEKGKKKIDFVLENIKSYSTTNQADREVILIIFDIPEKKRSIRDSLRNYLSNNGYGKLQDSIWVSYIDSVKDVEEVINDLNAKDMVTIIKTQKMNQIELKNFFDKTLYNWTKINNEYEKFLVEANKFLKLTKKESVVAKQLVFMFAKILQHDPKISDKNVSKISLAPKAFEQYSKIRSFCYSS